VCHSKDGIRRQKVRDQVRPLSRTTAKWCKDPGTLFSPVGWSDASFTVSRYYRIFGLGGAGAISAFRRFSSFEVALACSGWDLTVIIKAESSPLPDCCFNTVVLTYIRFRYYSVSISPNTYVVVEHLSFVSATSYYFLRRYEHPYSCIPVTVHSRKDLPSLGFRSHIANNSLQRFSRASFNHSIVPFVQLDTSRHAFVHGLCRSCSCGTVFTRCKSSNLQSFFNQHNECSNRYTQYVLLMCRFKSFANSPSSPMVPVSAHILPAALPSTPRRIFYHRSERL
jgi:hypothetical protein